MKRATLRLIYLTLRKSTELLACYRQFRVYKIASWLVVLEIMTNAKDEQTAKNLVTEEVFGRISVMSSILSLC